MLGHMVSVVSFKQNDSAVSQGGCPVLRPHRQCMSDPAASLAAFGDTTNHLSHPGTCVVCLTLIPRLCLTLRPHRLARQAPLSMESSSRQKYWSGLPFPSPVACLTMV